MWRNDVSMIAVLLLACGARAPAAMGHSFLLSRGTATVRDDRIDVDLEVSAEDLLHYGLLRPSGGQFPAKDIERAVDEFAPYLLNHFNLRDGEGRRIEGSCRETTLSPSLMGLLDFQGLRGVRIQYALRYPLTSPARHLTFRQRLGDGVAALPSQIVLSVRRVDSEQGRMIVLTNRGNAETVTVSPADEIRRAEDAMTRLMPGASGDSTIDICTLRVKGDERFSEVHAFAQSESNSVRLVAYIPFMAMETFFPLNRAEADFLSAEEVAAVERRLADHFRLHPPVAFKPASAGESAGRIGQIAVLGPDEATLSEAPIRAHRVGVWSARIGMLIECHRATTATTGATLEWTMFNATVMNATVWKVDSSGGREEHALFPGDATLSPASAPIGVEEARRPKVGPGG